MKINRLQELAGIDQQQDDKMKGNAWDAVHDFVEYRLGEGVQPEEIKKEVVTMVTKIVDILSTEF